MTFHLFPSPIFFESSKTAPLQPEFLPQHNIGSHHFILEYLCLPCPKLAFSIYLINILDFVYYSTVLTATKFTNRITKGASYRQNPSGC